MKEGREPFHETEDPDREDRPGGEHGPQHQAPVPVVHLHPVTQDHCPEDLGELGVGQGEGPQPQVGGRVGDGPQSVLDSVDS